MSVEIKYKGQTIASANSDITKTLKTSGKYCDADIEVTNIQDGDTGGTQITDGIVVKARDASGNITEVDYYGDTVYPWTFGAGNSNNTLSTSYSFALQHLQTINFKNTVTSLKRYAIAGCTELTCVTGLDWSLLTEVEDTPLKYSSAWIFDVVYPQNIAISFYASGIRNVEATNLTQITNNSFYKCTSLISAKFPKASVIGTYASNVFKNCTALQTAEFGSIGHAVVSARPDAFSGCTQNTLTITAYTTGGNVDTLVTNFRNSATNATIIIKASENTTYNGASYSAGDTMLTSEVA